MSRSLNHPFFALVGGLHSAGFASSVTEPAGLSILTVASISERPLQYVNIA
ncbi:hypothetical protein [Novosphingobium endophyticum]|uniref:hypothetical protein n=1 Tax=Novosphingobium endophyticum TaxID=1955250 RepID=UPI00166EE00D|nr:hypothetical protein [Novosphingobium endophyticum]